MVASYCEGAGRCDTPRSERWLRSQGLLCRRGGARARAVLCRDGHGRRRRDLVRWKQNQHTPAPTRVRAHTHTHIRAHAHVSGDGRARKTNPQSQDSKLNNQADKQRHRDPPGHHRWLAHGSRGGGLRHTPLAMCRAKGVGFVLRWYGYFDGSGGRRGWANSQAHRFPAFAFPAPGGRSSCHS